MARTIKIRVWYEQNKDSSIFTVGEKEQDMPNENVSIKILLSNETQASTMVERDVAWDYGWYPKLLEKDSHYTSNIKKIIISKSIFKPEHKLHGDL